MKQPVLLAGSVITAVALALTGCSSAAPATSAVAEDCSPVHADLTTLSSGTLKLSVYVSEPYSSLATAGGDLGGIDGKIIAKIAEMECLALDAAPVDGAAVIASVQTSRADAAIGGIYYSEDRASTLNLTDPLYRDGMSILSPDGYSDLADLRGKSVGVIQGYLWNEELQNALGTDSVKIYQDSTSLLNDLRSGRVDAAIFTSAEAAYRAKADDSLKAEAFAATDEVPSSTAPGKVVIPVVKGDDSLTSAFNEDIATLIEDGTIAGILETEGLDPSLAGAGS